MIRKICRNLLIALYVVLALAWAGGYCLYLFSAGYAPWTEVEPWVGEKPEVVDSERMDDDCRWLLRVDADWVARTAAALHAEPYTPERGIDAREDQICGGRTVLKRYRCPGPVLLYYEKGGVPVCGVAPELWELQGGYAMLDWKRSSAERSRCVTGKDALLMVRRGEVVDAEGNTVQPDRIAAPDAVCVLMPLDEPAAPVLVQAEPVYATYRNPWVPLLEIASIIGIAAMFTCTPVLVDGAWLWCHRRMPACFTEYAYWLLIPLVSVPLWFIAVAAYSGEPFMAIVATVFYGAAQFFISLILFPLGKLLCALSGWKE